MCENHEHSKNEHGHNHEHCNHGINLNIIFLSIVLFVIAVLEQNSVLKLLLYTAAYLTAGYSVIYQALKNLLNGKIFDENFLMTIATIGAFCLGEYPEAVSVMVLYLIGEYLQHKAVANSHKSVSDLMDICPDYANIESEGEVKKVNPSEVKPGSIILIKPGEKIPIDGVVTFGNSFIDTSSLTGESVLVEVKEGNEVLSGSINMQSLIRIKTTKLFKDSAVSKILELVENASSKKSTAEKFITKFARYYTPVVVICALLLVVIPFLAGVPDIKMWVQRALTFLVISCPCALVISVPLTFFCAIGSASKKGILIKGSGYIEKLSKPFAVVFDKTGTITKGVFKVTQIIPDNDSNSDDVLKYAAISEYYSNHPIAISLKEAYSKPIDSKIIFKVNELAGKGVKVNTENAEIIAGNETLMNEYNIGIPKTDKAATVIYVAVNKQYKGCILISDELKPQSKDAVYSLKKITDNVVMLTGDSERKALETARECGIDKVYSNLLPADKVNKLEELINMKKGNVIFAGDGINDAPVLMRSDVGIAMGALGSDAAIEAADVVITDDNPFKIYTAIDISKFAMRIVKQNIILAIGVKFLFLALSTVGLMTMWGAIFADVGVTLLAVLNSLRMMKSNKTNQTNG